MAKKIKAVLFDLDGVLVDATEWHYDALNRALGLFGFAITRYEHLTSYNGLPTRNKLEMLSVEKSLPRGLHQMINRIKQKYTREEILSHCAPMFEKELMIRQLTRDGYRLAVCSNSIRDSITLMLTGVNLAEAFEFIISNEDVAKPKPDPEIYLAALARLKLSAAEVVVVEDAPHGVLAAERAGIHVCRVAGYQEVNYERVHGFIQRLETEG